MKKLLLFALFAPLAMQSEVKAAVAPASFVEKFFIPWGAAANASYRNLGPTEVSFNKRLDVATAVIGTACFAYNCWFGEPLKNTSSHSGQLIHLLTKVTPRGLAFHELYKRSGMLIKGNPQHIDSWAISFAKIALCLADKLFSETSRQNLLRRANILV